MDRLRVKTQWIYRILIICLVFVIGCATQRTVVQHKTKRMMEANSMTCMNRLKHIDNAKMQYALEFKKSASTPSPDFNTIKVYLNASEQGGTCPTNGKPYLMGKTITDSPTCPNYNPNDPEFAGHKLQ
jgi:hypothetical protein